MDSPTESADCDVPVEHSHGSAGRSGQPELRDVGEYVVVARRYRPQAFDELIGQEHVARALTQAIATDRVGHAYLFTGARGVGKTSAARILAKALNCVKGPTSTPCNQCDVCLSVAAGEDVDVLEIDGASNRGIDEIRQLRQNAAIRPSRTRFKIYIIDEVHMLTKEAFNALLKTLEEPPEHVKFIFATTEPNKIPITILSRCQRFDFAGIDAAAIQSRLAQIAAAEGVSIEPDALAILALRAAGSMRDSQSLLEQLLSVADGEITAEHVYSLLGIAPVERLSRLGRHLAEGQAAAALGELDGALADGADVGQLVDQLLGYFRDAMALAAGCGENQLLYALPSQVADLRSVAASLGIQRVLAIIQILDQSAARMRVSVQARTLAELAAVRICNLENLDDLAGLIAELREGGATSSTSPAAASAGAGRTGKANSPAPRERPATSASVSSVAEEPSSIRSTAIRSAPELKQETRAAMHRVDAAADSAAAARQPAPLDSNGIDAIGRPDLKAATGDLAAAAREVRPITNESADKLWQDAVMQLNDTLAGAAAHADRIVAAGPGRLSIVFPASHRFSKDRCERPENRARLEEVLSQIHGSPLKVEFEVDATLTSTATPQPPSPQQLRAAAAERPFVRRAMELFGIESQQIRYVPPAGGSQ